MTALRDKLASFKKPAHLKLPEVETAQNSATAWQRLIDERLIEWGRHPEQFEDDGLKAPTADVLVKACDFVAFCRDHDIDPPLRAAPDGSGGIVFEWKLLPFFYTVEIRASGNAELVIFENNKLMARQSIG